MKKIFFTCLFLGFLNTNAQQVKLDPTFGNAGISVIPNTSEINDIEVDEFGNIYSAGYNLLGGGTGIYHQILTKHNSDGQLDLNFGTNGIVNSEIDYSEMPYAIAIQNDGKILVAGSYYVGPNSSGPGDHRAYVMRYQSNGSLDSTFGIDGLHKFYTTNSHFNKIILLSDQKILLGGNGGNVGLIVKLNSNGTFDTQFGTDGSLYLNDANLNFIFWDFIQSSDQNIICAGYDISEQSNYKLALLKLDLQGNYNHGFAQHGKFILDRHANSTPIIVELLRNVEELPDGKLLVGGHGMTNILLKLNSNGSFDNTFGVNGIAEHIYPYSDFVVQNDGKIIVSGSKVMSEYNYGISTTRFLSNGTLDIMYSDSGHFNIDISNKSDYVQCIKLQEDQKLLIGGSTRLNTDANFLLARVDMDAATFISNTNADENDFLIYPNPFSDEFKIISINEDIVKAKMLDYTGKIIKDFHIDNKIQSVMVDVPSGIYQLILVTKEGTQITKKLQKH